MKIKFLLLIIVAVFSQNINAQYTKLFDFAGVTDGANPYGDLYYDGTFFYGMTQFGGVNNKGTLFKIKPDGTGYVKLVDFVGTNGARPVGSIISDGTFLYGMTLTGGTNNIGVLFKIKPDGTGYVNLLNFNQTNGRWPWGSLISDGTFLYGMTSEGGGGANNTGVLFKMKTDGTGYLKLHEFNSSTNGGSPFGSLISDGTFLYGMTMGGGGGTNCPSAGCGTIFKIKFDGTGFVKLHVFNYNDGEQPRGSLISDGTFLYGMASYGGANNKGVLFKIKSDGTGYLKLLDFDGTNGTNPIGSLISDGGFLYGMTIGGGVNNLGLLFKIKTDGTGYVKLLDFSGVNGQNPIGSLISAGTALYGMTESGGTNNFGVIFKYGLIIGISENNLEKDLMIYPNPTSGQFQISSGLSAITDLQIYNVLGEMVYEKSPELKGASKISVSLPESLRNGIYFAQLKTEQGTAKKMIMLSR